MKGLLLDVYDQEVKEIDCDSDIHEWYKLLNCELVEMPERTIAGRSYTIICDEEGLLKSDPVISAINGQGEVMLVGSLLIFNTDYENCDVTDLTDEDIKYIRHYINSCLIVNKKTGHAREQLILTECDY